MSSSKQSGISSSNPSSANASSLTSAGKKSPTLILNKNNLFLYKLGKIIRITALSVLFAGSAAIVFAAITLVKVAQSHGVSVSTAAMANAPIFLQFGKVAAVSAVALLMAEAIDSFFTITFSQSKVIQYITTALCALCVFNFSFVIAPEMEHLLPYIATNPGVQQSFHTLHNTSRLIFSGIIFFAWVSLLIPVIRDSRT